MADAKQAFIPYEGPRLDEEASLKGSRDFLDYMSQRRTLRAFSEKPVPREVIENVILTASSAPSGAHKQPWTFCVITSPGLKKRIREAAEEEEYENYHGRMGDAWLQDLEVFGTDWHKPFLETAPFLIAVFKKVYDRQEGEKQKNYYVNESVGLATGFLLAALHHAGLVALTHTPSPMKFLNGILGRPKNEKPYILFPVGYPSIDATVPDLHRKTLSEVSQWYNNGAG